MEADRCVGRAAGLAALVIAVASAATPAQQPLLGDLFAPPAGRRHRLSSAHVDGNSNLDFRTLAAGAEMTLARINGAGVIRHLWLTVSSDDPYYSRMIVLRARWDGETAPSVDVPIGDFFGVGHALDVDVDTLPIRVAGDGRARSSFWPMPFNENAEISLRNDSPRPARLLFWQIDWTEAPKCVGLRTFHASFRASPRNGTLRQHKVAEIGGLGHYVGTQLSIWSGESGWPGEGDERFFIDGDELPTFTGVGLESAFSEAWGFRTGSGPFGGVTHHEGDGSGARTSAVRWFLTDPIPFKKGLGVTFERAGYERRRGEDKFAYDRHDAFSSVAYWYQIEPHVLYPALPSQSERLPFAELRIEPEEKEWLETAVVGEGVKKPFVQGGEFFAYGAQVRFEPPDRDSAILSLPFEFGAERSVDLYARLTCGPDCGVWELWIDGKRVGSPFDCFSPRARLRDLRIGSALLTEGAHLLELRGAGRNLESTGLALGLDSVMLRWYP